jgi:hypothetical protein
MLTLNKVSLYTFKKLGWKPIKVSRFYEGFAFCPKAQRWPILTCEGCQRVWRFAEIPRILNSGWILNLRTDNGRTLDGTDGQ